MTDSEPQSGFDEEWAAYCLGHDLFRLTVHGDPERNAWSMSFLGLENPAQPRYLEQVLKDCPKDWTDEYRELLPYIASYRRAKDDERLAFHNPHIINFERIRHALRILSDFLVPSHLIDLSLSLGACESEFRYLPPSCRMPFSAEARKYLPDQGCWESFISKAALPSFSPRLVTWGKLGHLLCQPLVPRMDIDGILMTDIERLLESLPPLANILLWLRSSPFLPPASVLDSLAYAQILGPYINEVIMYSVLGKPRNVPLLDLEPGLLTAFGTAIPFGTNPIPPHIVFLWILMERPGKVVGRAEIQARDPVLLNRTIENMRAYAVEARDELESAYGKHTGLSGEPLEKALKRLIDKEKGTKECPGGYVLNLKPHEVRVCEPWRPGLLSPNAPR